MGSFSVPPQVESLESREMWKGFILTVVEVRLGASSGTLFSPSMPQSSTRPPESPTGVSRWQPLSPTQPANGFCFCQVLKL